MTSPADDCTGAKKWDFGAKLTRMVKCWSIDSSSHLGRARLTNCPCHRWIWSWLLLWACDRSMRGVGVSEAHWGPYEGLRPVSATAADPWGHVRDDGGVNGHRWGSAHDGLAVKQSGLEFSKPLKSKLDLSQILSESHCSVYCYWLKSKLILKQIWELEFKHTVCHVILL